MGRILFFAALLLCAPKLVRANSAVSASFPIDTRHSVSTSASAESLKFKIDTRGAGVAFTAFSNSGSFPIDTRGAGSTIGALQVIGSGNFGGVAVGAAADRLFQVRNLSAGTLALNAGTAAPFLITGSAALTIAPGELRSLWVRFMPTFVGTTPGALVFTGTGTTVFVSLTGTGTAAAGLTLASVSPSPVTATNEATAMTLTGSGFAPGAKVTWRNRTSGQIYKDRVPTTLSESQATLNAVFGLAAAQWSAQIVNPDGAASNEVAFSVTVPGAPGVLGMRFEDGGGRSIGGACTDGAAIVRVVLTNVPDSAATAGIAFTAPSADWTPSGSVQRNLAADTAWRNYVVPDVYPGGTAITKDVIFSGNVEGSTADETLTLTRPPVVFVHGLWSGPETFADMRRQLRDAGFGILIDVDYSFASSAAFDVNKDRVAVRVLDAIRAATTRGYACTKADVVGHSMGGVLTRYYTQDLGQIKYKDNIRRIITIGTPHAGSEMAYIARAVGLYLESFALDAFILRTMLAAWTNINLTGDAVRDLQLTSTATRDVLNGAGNFPPGRHIPSHAIVGAFPSTETRGLLGLFWKVVKWKFPPLNIYSLLGTPNDLVVRGTSQQGGLSNAYSSELTAAPFGHISETGNDQIIARVRTLLNASQSGPGALFDPQGFDEPVSLSLFDLLESVVAVFSIPLPAPVQPLTAGQEISITQPLDGAFVHPGEIVSVLVEAGVDVTRVMIGATESEVLESPPFEFQFQIPLEYEGPMMISALGSDAAGTFSSSSQIEIEVLPTTATLQLLRMVPDENLIMIAGETRQLIVLGEFNDGATRDMAPGARGTTYVIEDSTIATVDADGLVTGGHPGFTWLKAINGDREDEIVVTVLPTTAHITAYLLGQDPDGRGMDMNGDGVVDVADVTQNLLENR